jgi:hypothetical protein
MPLSDTAIKNAKTKETAYKLPDEKGMYLLVSTSGGRYFRFDYRFGGKRKTLALGVYPETSLKQARDKRDDARSQLADGIDPSEIRKTDKIVMPKSIHTVNTNAKKVLLCSCVRLKSGCNVSRLFLYVTKCN